LWNTFVSCGEGKDLNTSLTSTTNMKNMLCGKCGYTWQYQGELERATCPNCGTKNKTRKDEGEQKWKTTK